MNFLGTSSKKSKSGTGSSTRTSTKPGSKSSSRSKSTPKTNSPEEWSDWAQDPNPVPPREYRVRENAGEWEYEYRYPDELNTPRYSGPGGGTSLRAVDEDLEDESQPSFIPGQDRLSASPTEFRPNYTTTSGDASYEANPVRSSLSQEFARTGLTDSTLTQSETPSYKAQQGSLGDDEDSLTTSGGPRNQPQYRYQIPQATPQILYQNSISQPGQPNPEHSNVMQPSPSPWAPSNQPAADMAPSGSAGSERYFSGEAQQEAQQDLGSPKMNELKAEYKLCPAREFRFLRVFKILWTEPMGQGMPGNGRRTEAEVQNTKYGQEVYSSIRRFVIVHVHQGHCLCLPILTYGRQATNKTGVKPQDHAIIYTEDKSKKGEKPKEAPGEQKLRNTPIRMHPKTARDQLDPLSRLNYAKVYTVEYNVKVHFIGDIHKNSKDDFCATYNEMHQPLPTGDSVQFEDDNEEQWQQQ